MLFFDLSVDDMCSVFQSELLFAISLASINVKKINYGHKFVPLKKWISRGLLVSINRKNKLNAKKVKRPFDRNFTNYFLRYKNLLQILIKKARNLYYIIYY